MHYRKLSLAVFAILAMPAHYVWAQVDDRQVLIQRIDELTKKLEAMDARLKVEEAKSAGAPAPKAPPAEAPPVLAPAPAPAAQTGAVRPTNAGLAAGTIPVQPANSVGLVAVGPGGFTIESADNDFSLKIGADLQTDLRTFTGAGSGALPDQLLLRRVRPTFSGTVFKYVDYYLRPDFGQGTTVIYDAYAQINYIPHFALRVGKFKPPVGLERLQSDDDTSFIERGLPTLLVPSRSIGFQIAGDLWPHRIGYQVGVFNPVPDNSLSDTLASNSMNYVGRVFTTPFQPNENFLSGLGFGIGVQGGSVDGVALPAYKTIGQNTFFTFASGVTSAGHRFTETPQAFYYLGPFGLLAEDAVTAEDFQKGNARRYVAFRSWQVQVSYILTGEKKSFGSPVPRRQFAPFQNGWGAWEVAFRTGDFSVDPGLFAAGFASPSTSPHFAREWVGGVNWYLNRILRISMDYGYTGFQGGAANSADRAAERVILARFQINFI
jgi:phosphate-selective porin OprO/OprP